MKGEKRVERKVDEKTETLEGRAKCVWSQCMNVEKVKGKASRMMEARERKRMRNYKETRKEKI